MILGNKIIVSYFYGINPAQAENPIFSFYVSGTQTSSEKYGKIRRSLFWKEEDVGAKESSKRSPEGQKGVAHAAPVPGHVGPTILALGAPQPTIFSPPPSS